MRGMRSGKGVGGARNGCVTVWVEVYADFLGMFVVVVQRVMCWFPFTCIVAVSRVVADSELGVLVSFVFLVLVNVSSGMVNCEFGLGLLV